MTIKELKDELENYDDNLTIRIAEQPSYPFGYSIDGLAEYKQDDKTIIYILEGVQQRGLPKDLFN